MRPWGRLLGMSANGRFETKAAYTPFFRVAACVAILWSAFAHADAPYPWLKAPSEGTIESRVPTPPGWKRPAVAPGSFAAWLRNLPVKPGRPEVHLFNGKVKENQTAHVVVLDVDTGRRDLQQCADAVMRLRAEFQRYAGNDGEICFRFTDGTEARWAAWKEGKRPTLAGRKMTWEKRAPSDAGYPSFRRYLDIVFGYAGTASLARELDRVSEPRLIEAGDVFIQGGAPGHAVIVVDVAEDARGRRAVLLAQSYMPAQEIHILRSPAAPDNPWYTIEGDGPLTTPEWDFPAGSLRRFGEPCGRHSDKVIAPRAHP
jgi:hypothetical protein